MFSETSSPEGNPSITVVIPCYNAQQFIGRTIRSVLSQEKVCLQIIVIDDGSTDGSLDEIRGFGNQVQFETGSNKGACAARNRGLQLATAPFVMFLDADDFLEGPILYSLAVKLVNNNADLAIGPCKDTDVSGLFTYRRPPRTDSARALLIDWLNGQYMTPCSLLWRTTFVQKIGGWREHLKMNQDGDLVLRAAVHGLKVEASSYGCGVHWNHNSPSRISKNISEKTLMSSFSVLVDLIDALGEVVEVDDGIRKAISTATHGLEKRALLAGLKQSTMDIEGYRRSKGFPRFEGSFGHKIVSSILGVKRKELLSSFLHEIIKKRKSLISRL